MKEEKIYIQNKSLLIEGLLGKYSDEEAVVICHPHSLMGGSMYNNVVDAIRQAFFLNQTSTLRFNFRGVGGSTGSYDEGRGETEDIMAAADYLRKQGMERLAFAGYSFGAWVGSKIIARKDNPFSCSIFVAPPLNFFDFDWHPLDNKVDVLIGGDADEYCDVKTLTAKAKGIHSRVEIISGADHFYGGYEANLIAVLRKYCVTKKT